MILDSSGWPKLPAAWLVALAGHRHRTDRTRNAALMSHSEVPRKRVALTAMIRFRRQSGTVANRGSTIPPGLDAYDCHSFLEGLFSVAADALLAACCAPLADGLLGSGWSSLPAAGLGSSSSLVLMMFCTIREMRRFEGSRGASGLRSR